MEEALFRLPVRMEPKKFETLREGVRLISEVGERSGDKNRIGLPDPVLLLGGFVKMVKLNLLPTPDCELNVIPVPILLHKA